MTTYSAITSGQIDAESYIDTVLAGQWSNNVLAMFEGDGSASGVRLQTAALEQTASTEAVTQACIRDEAVGKAQIKSTGGTVSLAGTVTTDNYTEITMNPYSFFPMIHTDNSVEDISAGDFITLSGHGTDGADPDLPRFRLINTDTGTVNYDIDYRYIPA